MSRPRDDQTEDRRLLKELAKSADAHIAARAEKLLLRTRLPMHLVIDKVPGETLEQKAKAIGVTRQTLWYWQTGVTRPNKRWAKRLAALIEGIYTADEIRGRAA